MGTRLSDSEQYAHLWGTPELAEVFDERARLQSWLDIITALAVAQARLGIIPDGGGRPDRRACTTSKSSTSTSLAVETRRTSHSMLGLINALHQVLPDVGQGARVRRRHGPGRDRHVVRPGHA